MELLLVITRTPVKHTKAKGHVSELTFALKARQNEIEDLEREVVRLRGDMQVKLQQLQRFRQKSNHENPTTDTQRTEMQRYDYATLVPR